MYWISFAFVLDPFDHQDIYTVPLAVEQFTQVIKSDVGGFDEQIADFDKPERNV